MKPVCSLYHGLFFVIALAVGAITNVCGQTPPRAEETFDLAIYQATPGGIAMAVRAAREGLQVLLVNHNEHLGGILSSGLGVWDTLYEGKRAPIYDEVRQAIFDYYRTTYGETSAQYRDALPGATGHSNGRFEPHVAEKILTDLVAREKRITVWRSFMPMDVTREGAQVSAATFRSMEGGKAVRVRAKVFADCSYEGDLLALAKVPYRVGREARSEFQEPHAGKVFMREVKPLPPAAQRAVEEHHKLNLRKFAGWQEIVQPGSTGEGDGEVQAFNYRTILSSDPANQLAVTKPADYDAEALRRLDFGSVVRSIPNNKLGWNRPQLVGPHTAYVEGDVATRRRVLDEHWAATLGLLYFLQNDESVPPVKREFWQKFGLAKDEFAGQGHRPYEIYVREARRLVGRAIFAQHDAMLSPGLRRAPVHGDSIAATEWYLDTHACTTERTAGSLDEGKMMLHHETYPGQISYRCLLPQGVDNLLVPVCLSATHVAWGTVRLEPTWMNVAESAALATVQTVRNGQAPAAIDTDRLLRTLAERRVMISFFNDVELGSAARWIPAAQFFGAKGFFTDYDVRAAAPLGKGTGELWARALADMRAGKLDVRALAKSLSAVDDGEPISRATFTALLPSSPSAPLPQGEGVLTRGEALEMLWSCLP